MDGGGVGENVYVEGMVNCEVLHQSGGLLVTNSTMGSIMAPEFYFLCLSLPFCPHNLLIPMTSRPASFLLSLAVHMSGIPTLTRPPRLGPSPPALTVPCCFSSQGLHTCSFDQHALSSCYPFAKLICHPLSQMSPTWL